MKTFIPVFVYGSVKWIVKAENCHKGSVAL